MFKSLLTLFITLATFASAIAAERLLSDFEGNGLVRHWHVSGVGSKFEEVNTVAKSGVYSGQLTSSPSSTWGAIAVGNICFPQDISAFEEIVFNYYTDQNDAGDFLRLQLFLVDGSIFESVTQIPVGPGVLNWAEARFPLDAAEFTRLSDQGEFDLTRVLQVGVVLSAPSRASSIFLDDVVATSQETSCVSTGMWIWDQSILSDDAKIGKLINDCRTYGISKIAFSINWNEPFQADEQNLNRVREFLFAMHTAGINVEYLAGGPDWIQGHQGFLFAKRLMDRVVDFQLANHGDPMRRFDGLCIDVEPHVNGWNLNTPKSEIEGQLQGFYDMLVVFQAIIDRDYSSVAMSGLQQGTVDSLEYSAREWTVGSRPDLMLSVVPWYHSPIPAGHPEAGESVMIRLVDGSFERADKAIYSVPNQISLIGYRDQFDGGNGYRQFNFEALETLASLNKPVNLGFEFLSPRAGVPSQITLGDNTYQEFENLRVAIEENLLDDYPNVVGIKYHEYPALLDFIANNVSNSAANLEAWRQLHCLGNAGDIIQ